MINYIRNVRLNLLSCSSLDEKCVSTRMKRQQSRIVDRDDRYMLICRMRKIPTDGLFAAQIIARKFETFDSRKRNAGIRQGNDTHEGSAEMLWHQCTAHADKEIIAMIIKSYKYGMRRSARTEGSSSETCVRTTQVKSPVVGKLLMNSEDITIHADIYGSFQNNEQKGT